MIDASPGPASILAGLPTDLSSRLFAGAIPHRLRPGEELFHAGNAGEGCVFTVDLPRLPGNRDVPDLPRLSSTNRDLP